jgi:large subunit ribosomal protein L17
MRHGKKIKKFNRATEARLALLYSEVRALLKYGKIKLTVTRAKNVRQIAEKLVTFAKRGDLNSIKLAAKIVKDKDLLKNFFKEVKERFAERQGGYTRIIRIGPRRGDNAPMSVLELV